MAYPTKLNLTAFHEAQRRTEQTGTQITPQEWQEMGGNPREYANLYGGNAYYRDDGTLTPMGQQAGAPSAPFDDRQNRHPLTGEPVVPGTDITTGMGGAPNAPPAMTTDPQGLVNAQNAWGQIDEHRQTLGNRLNQDTTFGSRTFDYDPTTGRQTVTDRLDPWGERRYEQDQETSYKAGEQVAGQVDRFGQQQPFSIRGNVDPALSQGDLLGERRRVEDQVAGAFERRNAPRFRQEQQELMQSLADRGIDTNSKRAQYEMQQLSQRQEDARLNSQARASELGRGEFETAFGASEQVRGRETDEYREDFYSPLTGAGALRGLQTPMQLPQFKNISDIDTNFVNPAAIGTTTRGQDTAYNTAVDVANIQESGATARKGMGVEAEANARAAAEGNPGASIPDPYNPGGGGSTANDGSRRGAKGMPPQQQGPEQGSLDWQVQQGWITPEQANAEKNRQYQANNPYQQKLGQPKAPPQTAAKGGFQ